MSCSDTCVSWQFLTLVCHGEADIQSDLAIAALLQPATLEAGHPAAQKSSDTNGIGGIAARDGSFTAQINSSATV